MDQSSGAQPAIPDAAKMKPDNATPLPASSTVNGSPDAADSPAEPEKPAKPAVQAYSAFTPARRRTILALVTIAGFLGPLAGNIYLPALPRLSDVFGVGITEINVSVTVFMAVFAFGVSAATVVHKW